MDAPNLTPLSPVGDAPEKPRRPNLVPWIVGTVLTGLGVGVIAVVVFAVGAIRDGAAFNRGRICLSNVKSLSLAMRMYADGNDGLLPPPVNWMADLNPYAHSRRVFRCPSVRRRDRGTSGYAMNVALAGKNSADLKDVAQTPVIFDSTDTRRNAVGGLDLLPDPPRHPGGNTVGYLDGHASRKPANGSAK